MVLMISNPLKTPGIKNPILNQIESNKNNEMKIKKRVMKKQKTLKSLTQVLAENMGYLVGRMELNS